MCFMASQSRDWGGPERKSSWSRSCPRRPSGAVDTSNRCGGAAEEFFTSFDMNCDLFQSFYPAIAWEMHNGDLPLSFGTVQHQALAWDFAREAWPLHQKGARARPSRWFQVTTMRVFRLGAWLVEEIKSCSPPRAVGRGVRRRLRFGG